MTTRNFPTDPQSGAAKSRSSRLVALLAGFGLPLMLLVFVPVLRHLADGEPGGWVGFRTVASTSSVENWQTAQTMAANHFLVIGLVSLALTVIVYLVLARISSTTPKSWWWASLALTVLQLIALGISTFVIDRSLPRIADALPEIAPAQIGWPIFFGLLTPVMAIVCGPLLHKVATKDANWHTGYRTPKSMSLQHPENWSIANNAAATVFLVAGIVSTIAAITVFAIMHQGVSYDQNAWWAASLFFALVPLIPVVAAVPFIERKLRS